MKFTDYVEAVQLAERIRREAPHVQVNEIFPANELETNKDQYPAGSYLVSCTLTLPDGNSEEWFQSEEHWNAIGWAALIPEK